MTSVTAMFEKTVDFIKSKFPGQSFIPLHEPRFIGKEREYVLKAIDSTFVSSVGAYVDTFEKMMAEITGATYCVATVNGTAGLHIALVVAGVSRHDEVLTQALTFIATTNAISYTGAAPVFIDIDRNTLGMSAEKLQQFLQTNAEKRSDGFSYNKRTGKRFAACVPMHTFGFPCHIDEISRICRDWNIKLVEDAAESIGSRHRDSHTGTTGLMGVFSFNGNKTITCGGGGAVITNDESVAKRLKHLTTQAKQPHAWEFNHDAVGYNYRMPNLNAAMACAQLEQLEAFVSNKRELAEEYRDFFQGTDIEFKHELPGTFANYWLNVVLLRNRDERDAFLSVTNSNGVMTRPAWTLMNKLTMFSHCQHDGLENSLWVEDRLVNIPSSVRLNRS